MHIYFGGFLALGSLAAIGYLLWRGHNGQMEQIPGVMGGAWLSVFLLALIAPDPVTATYKGTVLFCLLLLGLGVAFYRGIPAPAAVAVGIFMLATGVLFMVWQAHTTAGIPSPLGLLAPALAGLVYWRLWSGRVAGVGRNDPRGDIVALLTILMLATWQAIELWTQQTAYWSAFAMLSALTLWSVVGVHLFGTARAGLPNSLRVEPAPMPVPIMPTQPEPATATAAGPTTVPAPEAVQPIPAAPAVPRPSPVPIYTLGLTLLAGLFLALSVWTYFDRL